MAGASTNLAGALDSLRGEWMVRGKRTGLQNMATSRQMTSRYIEHIWVHDFSPYADQFVSRRVSRLERIFVERCSPVTGLQESQSSGQATKASHYAKQKPYAASLVDSTFQHRAPFTPVRQCAETLHHLWEGTTGGTSSAGRCHASMNLGPR